MKKILAAIILVGVGLFVLAGYFFRTPLGPILGLFIDWGILLVGVTGLIGIGYLLRTHFIRLFHLQKGAFSSSVVLIAFIFTLTAGLILTPRDPLFQDLILNVQIPVETSLLSILAVMLLYGSLRLVRTRGWTPLSVAFLFSAVFTLIFNLGYLQAGGETMASQLLLFLRRLPLAGARGILLGMALGGLIVGLRVLLNIDPPYGE